MSKEKKQMIVALKDKVIPILRAEGFTGTFPYYYRQNKNRADFISFVFSVYGGNFRLTVGHYPTTDFRKSPKPKSEGPKEKIQTTIVFDQILKLETQDKKGPMALVREYEKTLDQNVYDEAAEEALKYINTEAKKFWNN